MISIVVVPHCGVPFPGHRLVQPDGPDRTTLGWAIYERLENRELSEHRVGRLWDYIPTRLEGSYKHAIKLAGRLADRLGVPLEPQPWKHQTG